MQMTNTWVDDALSGSVLHGEPSQNDTNHLDCQNSMLLECQNAVESVEQFMHVLLNPFSRHTRCTSVSEALADDVMQVLIRPPCSGRQAAVW